MWNIERCRGMIETRFTRAFGVQHPVVSAPMARVAGGALAAAVSRAGGLGLIGGGYGDADWISGQFDAAGNEAVGCGLITWRLAEVPVALDAVLARAPRAVFLSFGDPGPYAGAIRDAGAALICQVQSMESARAAVAAGADVLVAQGAEAGGHAGMRATMTLVPEVADFLAREAPETMLLAAGGIADGRGLAASLMLGADGVLMGTRFWAAAEALVHARQVDVAIAADGDATVRTRVVDIVRGFVWPEGYGLRVIENAFSRRWDGDLDGLRAVVGDEARRWTEAYEAGDVSVANPIAGEAIGLIGAREPAAEIIGRVVAEAEALLGGAWRRDV